VAARSLIACAVVATAAVGLVSACGASHTHAAIRVQVKVEWGAIAQRRPSTFSLTCKPTGGTLPYAGRICRDIARHGPAMLNPPKPRWSCGGTAGGPSLTVTTSTHGTTHTFGGEPWCDWPVGPSVEVYWAAIRHDVNALDRVEPTLRCEEDPVLLARPTPLASAVACVHGLWTPRSERLIRLAASVVPLSNPSPSKLFPHDIGAQACTFVGGGLSTHLIHGRCGVNVKRVWSTPIVTFVEAWPAGANHIRHHRWIVEIKDGQPRLARQSGPVPPRYWASANKQTTKRQPALAGFNPLSFTATGESDFWVLGTYPCSSRRCFTILQTNDGGKSFGRLDAPALPTSGTVPTLRFADSTDAFAFVQGVGGVFYATHDGGATWKRLSLGTLLAFASGGGNVYLVTAHCTLSRCSDYRFEHSPVSVNQWTSAPTPFTPDGSIVDLAAHGSSVWLLGTVRTNQRLQHDTLARSSDGGRTFVTGPGPCIPGLGGDLEPTSAPVIWATCPTGLMAGAWRSTDGGLTFTPLKTRGLVNSARLAAASDTTAVLAANGAGAPLLRTTDGGTTWSPVAGSDKVSYWPFIGFTDASVGAAIVQTGNAEVDALWRTTDGGLSWSVGALRSPNELVGVAPARGRRAHRRLGAGCGGAHCRGKAYRCACAGGLHP
jgi:photosystem II stability/assembly factor-like uncharacterized protein